MAFYDRYNYRKYWQNRQYEHEAERLALERLLVKIPNSKRGSILDLGAGFGRITPIYARQFSKCLLVEPSQKLLDQAQENLTQYPNLSFKRGQAETVKLPQKFDTILMIRVAHHISNLDLVLKNINRSLTEGGFLILEFANKINFKARLKMLLRGNFHFSRDLSSCDRRSLANINQRTILFLNHHPQKINQLLAKSGFETLDRLSVSNFRSPWLKKIIPIGTLLWAEKRLQLILAKNNFGPSIFILAKKKKSL